MKISFFIRLFVSVFVLGVLGLYVFYPQIRIDSFVLTLLAIALFPWILPLLRSVELPGGVKIELQDLKEIQKQMTEIGLIKKGKKSRKKYSFESISSQDANLALVGLRIELERILRTLAQENDLASRKKSIQKLTALLLKKDAITQEEGIVLQDLISLLNQAVHGAQVDPQATQWAMTTGVAILESLESKIVS